MILRRFALSATAAMMRSDCGVGGLWLKATVCAGYSHENLLAPNAWQIAHQVSGSASLGFVVEGAGETSFSFKWGKESPVVFFNLNFAIAVPEPAAWALLLIGFAGVGGMLRRRRSRSARFRATTHGGSRN